MTYYELDGDIVYKACLDKNDPNKAIIHLADGTILEVNYWTTRLIGGLAYVALQDIDLDFELKELRR